MEQAYAQALWQVIENGMTPSKAVHAMHTMLTREGREVLMPKIAHAFERLSAIENRKNTLTLSVAHEKDARDAKKEVESILKAINAAAEDVETKIDESLIGGWRFEGREQLVDASFKKYLLEMYNRATV